jgi:hypothetical protein
VIALMIPYTLVLTVAWTLFFVAWYLLGIPLGKRSRFQRTASSVVDKATEPARKLGSRFSRD